MKNGQWISADVQVRIEPPPISPIKVELEELYAVHNIKVKFWRNPSQTASETYKINISTFNDGQLEKFLALLRRIKIKIDETSTTPVLVWINYLRTMLCGTVLRE